MWMKATMTLQVPKKHAQYNIIQRLLLWVVAPHIRHHSQTYR